MLTPAEYFLKRGLSKRGKIIFTPIFIIGPPRSGTTLLYRVLTNHYQIGFNSNFTNKLYKSPLCGIFLEKSLRINDCNTGYNFEYGYIPGVGAPYEAGALWNRWYPQGGYVDSNETSKKILQDMRLVIRGMMELYQTPIVMKSVHNSMRVAPIIEALINARFIVCKRDYIDNSLSILRVRESKKEKQDQWWSVKPRQASKLYEYDLLYQAIAQVYYIHQQIDEDRIRFGRERFFDLNYEKFCNDVHGTLFKLEGFLSKANCKLFVKDSNIPHSFQIKRKEANYEQRLYIKKVLRILENKGNI